MGIEGGRGRWGTPTMAPHTRIRPQPLPLSSHLLRSRLEMSDRSGTIDTIMPRVGRTRR